MRQDSFGDRMKRYENVNRTYLTPRTPVIIRLDGKAFHTFTRGFKKPFDDILIDVMQETMKYLCANIQGCVVGYTQSDEITLVLIDYKNLDSCAWFDYNVQKMASVAASMATYKFNKTFAEAVDGYIESLNMFADSQIDTDYIETLLRARDAGALFDARVFNIPKEEVTNCIYWRQQDAVRNSIQAMGQAHFSQKQLQGKNTKEIKEMLLHKCGIDWDNLPIYKQRGSCCFKYTEVDYTKLNNKDGGVFVSYWFIDKKIPLFLKEDRSYIDDLIFIDED